MSTGPPPALGPWPISYSSAQYRDNIDLCSAAYGKRLHLDPSNPSADPGFSFSLNLGCQCAKANSRPVCHEALAGVFLYLVQRQGHQNALPFEGSGTLSVHSCALHSHRMLVGYEDFLTPPSLWAVDGHQLTKQLVQRLPPRFNAADLTISQAIP